jgi:transposase
MAKRLLTDDVWAMVEPFLPRRAPRSKGGRPPVQDRDALTGILFVLKAGIRWEHLPEEMGCGCGMTCLRRLRAWQRVGVWAEIENVLSRHLPGAHEIDWARARNGNVESRVRFEPPKLSARSPLQEAV